jgi:hypothetical protein
VLLEGLGNRTQRGAYLIENNRSAPQAPFQQLVPFLGAVLCRFASIGIIPRRNGTNGGQQIAITVSGHFPPTEAQREKYVPGIAFVPGVERTGDL